MKTSLIAKIIKKAINANTVLPILECVALMKDKLQVTDLEVCVTLPFNTGVNAALFHKDFLTVMDLMPEGAWTQKDLAIEVSQGKRKVKYLGDDNKNFPVPIASDAPKMKVIGNFTNEDIDSINTATYFASDDDLRPAMKGIHIFEQVASTDAHRLYWKPLSKPLEAEVILPMKAAELLVMIGGEWKVEFNTTQLRFTNEDGIEIITRVVDAKFPDYKVVIPEGIGNQLLSIDVKELQSEIKTGMKFANKATNQVVLTLGKETTLHASDVDLHKEYNVELTTAKVVKKNDLQIAFNGKFLSEILSMQDAKIPVRIKMWSESKAAIINDHFLIMPLMLNN